MKKAILESVRHPGISRAVFLTFSLVALSATFQPLIPLRISKVISNESETALYLGILYSMGGVASLAFGYLWGHATDLWGHKRILQWVLTGAATTAFLLSSAESILEFAIIFGVYSVFLCELSMLLNVNVAKSAPAQNLSQVFSLNHTGSQLGLAFGPILGGFFAQIFGINGAFVSTGILFLIFAMWLFLQNRFIPRGYQTD
jgi:MFS family permease